MDIISTFSTVWAESYALTYRLFMDEVNLSNTECCFTAKLQPEEMSYLRAVLPHPDGVAGKQFEKANSVFQITFANGNGTGVFGVVAIGRQERNGKNGFAVRFSLCRMKFALADDWVVIRETKKNFLKSSSRDHIVYVKSSLKSGNIEDIYRLQSMATRMFNDLSLHGNTDSERTNLLSGEASHYFLGESPSIESIQQATESARKATADAEGESPIDIIQKARAQFTAGAPQVHRSSPLQCDHRQKDAEDTVDQFLQQHPEHHGVQSGQWSGEMSYTRSAQPRCQPGSATAASDQPPKLNDKINVIRRQLSIATDMPMQETVTYALGQLGLASSGRLTNDVDSIMQVLC